MRAPLLALALLVSGAVSAQPTEKPAPVSALLSAPVSDSWSGDDKLRHVGVSFALGVAASYATKDTAFPASYATALALVPGLLKEATDPRASGRDVVANLAGALAGSLLGSRVIFTGTGVYYFGTFR
jgi:VanZ family protein